jgi:hypothetical protein
VHRLIPSSKYLSIINARWFQISNDIRARKNASMKIAVQIYKPTAQ